ncbi:uncharacterized protein LOC131598261 [Vicia villosa]|uniref:uncharacterized protein LOC131598261 n=1 Tax=Vicia villosa TaxID=3911 RepID=UPI00273A94EB|nr:uncharacterized protein LOC131598261 [Vicia villosa]
MRSGLLGGDFNAIKHRSERKERSLYDNDNKLNLFANFKGDSGLVDIPCKGKKFSWYSGDGKPMSRIDRFIVSDTLVNRWSVIGQMVGTRDILDHCPIWLVLNDKNWGPKNFKFNNERFSFKLFIPFVENEWREFKVEGRRDFVLKEKLRFLKERLKWLNKLVFGRIELEVEENVRAINFGDECLEEEIVASHSDSLFNRKETTRNFWLKLRIKENMLAQKSKVN